MMFVNNILVLCLAFRVIKCDPNPKTIVDDKVVGGEKYEINKLPYMVVIKVTANSCFCGGSIVNQLWVLTAAHCISSNDPKRFTVLVGSTRCYDIIDKNYQSIGVIKFYVHENYVHKIKTDPSYVYNDIGLVLLAKEIKFGPKVQPATLLTTDILKGKKPHEFFTEKCVASGWGILTMDRKSSPDLYGVELSLMDIDECAKFYVSISPRALVNKSGNVCTLERKGGKDVCQGDSGGPLVCNGYQIGVVSVGIGCALPGVPNLWTRVDMYNEWIKSTIREKPKSKEIKSKGNVIQILYYKLLVIAILGKCFLF